MKCERCGKETEKLVHQADQQICVACATAPLKLSPNMLSTIRAFQAADIDHLDDDV